MEFKQDLFWKNLPSKILRPTRSKDFIDYLIKHTFLNSIKEPYFIYTGTNLIDFSFLEKDKKIFQKLSKRKIKLFLYEPVSYYFNGENFNLSYYSEFHSKHNKSISLKAEELDCIDRLASKTKGIIVNHSDYGLGKLLGTRYPNITFKCRDIFIRQAALSYMAKNPIPVPKITKKFWCGNGRYTIHRHIVMCFLADKPGNYSWWFKGDTDWNSVVDWVEDLPIDYLRTNNKILNDNTWELDFSAPKVDIDEKHCLYLPEGPFSQPNIEYKKTFDECFVCIINETRFAQPTANFSEKVIDAINYRKPFIVVAPPKTLEYIKKFGFKTFDEFWSEDYDQIENHSQRMLEIFSLIDKINQKSIQELNDMYYEMLPILDHNRKVLKTLPKDNKVIDDN